MLSYIYSWFITFVTFILGTIAGHQGNWNGFQWTRRTFGALFGYVLQKASPLLEKTRQHWEPLWKKVEPPLSNVRAQILRWEQNAKDGNRGGADHDDEKSH